MIEPHVHVACDLRRTGLLYAVLWFADGADVLGWYTGGADGAYHASYLMLQDYHSRRPTHFYRSVQDDVYGPWVEVSDNGEVALPHPPPVPEPLCHELARLQDEFIRHWLFFDDDPEAQDEARALRERGMVLRHVNVRPSRLGKLRRAGGIHCYDSARADMNVLVYLSQRWPLEHQLAA